MHMPLEGLGLAHALALHDRQALPCQKLGAER
jgi:hypothetical protein